MSANRFSIDGSRIDSLSEFLRAENDNCFRDILYYPKEGGLKDQVQQLR